jgi:predicted ATPase
VFLLELLPLVQDYARTEDAPAQRRIHELLAEVYDALPFPVVRVPALSAVDRVEFILERIGIGPIGERAKSETPAM